MSFIAGYLLGLSESGGGNTVISDICDIADSQPAIVDIPLADDYSAKIFEYPKGFFPGRIPKFNVYYSSNPDYLVNLPYKEEEYTVYKQLGVGLYKGDTQIYVLSPGSASMFFPAALTRWSVDGESNRKAYHSLDMVYTYGEFTGICNIQYNFIVVGVCCCETHTTTCYDYSGEVTDTITEEFPVTSKTCSLPSSSYGTNICTRHSDNDYVNLVSGYHTALYARYSELSGRGPITQ